MIQFFTLSSLVRQNEFVELSENGPPYPLTFAPPFLSVLHCYNIILGSAFAMVYSNINVAAAFGRSFYH